MKGPMKSDIRAAVDKAQERRLKTIIRLYEQGKTTEDIANVLDLSRQRVHQICKAAGYQIQRKARYHGRHTK